MTRTYHAVAYQPFEGRYRSWTVMRYPSEERYVYATIVDTGNEPLTMTTMEFLHELFQREQEREVVA